MATPAELQQLYLSYFGRPADSGGISFYAQTPVATVVAAFSASPESRALYGTTFGAAQVSAIYQNLFNRPAEQAGSDAWVALVQSGAITPAGAALAILQGAANDDRVTVNNKLQVATAFTAALSASTATNALYAGTTAAANVRKFIATVDSSSTAVTIGQVQAKAQTVSILNGVTLPAVTVVSPTGGSFTLTTGGDFVAGTSADETIVGTDKTYSATADVIDGGAGTDTLSLSATLSGVDIPVASMSSVERLVAGGTNAFSVTFGNGVSGLAELVSTGPQVSFNNVPNVVNVSLTGMDAATTVKVLTTALGGTNDAVTLTLNGVGSNSLQSPKTFTLSASAPNANEFESLNIVSAGTTANAITLATDSTQTSLKTINISGPAALTLRLAADNIVKSATTINASSATGDITIGANGGVTLGAVNNTITLGSGNDAVYFGPNLTVADIVDGGGGTDTIGSTTTVTDAMMTNVRNFEVLAFDLNSGTVKQDAGIASLVGFNYAVTHGAGLVLSNMLNNTSVTVTGLVGLLTQTLRNNIGGNDSLSLVLDGGGAYAQLGTLSDIPGLETLRLSSVATSAKATTGTVVSNEIYTADQSTAAHIITGDTDLKISGPLATSLVDASAFTGKLNVTLGNLATKFQGGSGADTLWLGVAGSNYAAAHQISLGAGSDTVVFAGNNANGTGAATNYTQFANVSDFTVGGAVAGGDVVAFSSNRNDFSLRDIGGIAHVGLAGIFNTVTNSNVIKLATGVAFTTNVATTLANAMGSATYTNLVTNGNYMVLAYDTTNSKAVYAVVNTGGNMVNDTTLSAADFTATTVAVVGTLDMSASDYAAYILQA